MPAAHNAMLLAQRLLKPNTRSSNAFFSRAFDDGLRHRKKSCNGFL